MFHPNPKHPKMGIKLFNHAKMLCESAECLYVMENVRPAKDFVGHSVNHCGPFHLWGNGVPAIIPPDCYKVKKGMDMGTGAEAKKFKTSPEKIREYNTVHRWSHRDKVKEAAKVAIIPIELSMYIGQFAMQSLTLAVK